MDKGKFEEDNEDSWIAENLEEEEREIVLTRTLLNAYYHLTRAEIDAPKEIKDKIRKLKAKIEEDLLK